MSAKVLFGFHAVTVRLKTAPGSIIEIHVDSTRRDARMRQFVERAQAAGARLVESDDERLSRLCGSARHQGVVARVEPGRCARSIRSTTRSMPMSRAHRSCWCSTA
jgi:23S rRNA (guanosine2251-2'-O)-methyltransferase